MLACELMPHIGPWQAALTMKLQLMKRSMCEDMGGHQVWLLSSLFEVDSKPESPHGVSAMMCLSESWDVCCEHDACADTHVACLQVFRRAWHGAFVVAGYATV